MNKPAKIRDKRAKYVKQRIEDARNSTLEVKRLSRELFLSERTIERDLKRDLKK
jgi:DeoR/GlpR family transcriptional regulator of sugar metabolism